MTAKSNKLNKRISSQYGGGLSLSCFPDVRIVPEKMTVVMRLLRT